MDAYNEGHPEAALIDSHLIQLLSQLFGGIDSSIVNCYTVVSKLKQKSNHI